MPENKMSEIIETALDSLNKIADADTIVGQPIPVPDGSTVVPVSKVSVGFTSGGLDLNKKTESADAPQRFGGANAAGVSVTPLAFLILGADGRVSLLKIDSPAGQQDVMGTINDIIDKAPDMIEKIKTMFKRDKTDKAADKKKKDAGAADVFATPPLDNDDVK